MHKCINIINFTQPKILSLNLEMIIAQITLESGWGNSRFARRENNLFGIRTYKKHTPHLLPQSLKMGL